MPTIYYRQTYIPVQGQPKQRYDMVGELIEAGGGPPNNPPIFTPPTLSSIEKLFKEENGNLYEQIGDDKWIACGNSNPARISQMGLIQIDIVNEIIVKDDLQKFYRGEITAEQIHAAQGS